MPSNIQIQLDNRPVGEARLSNFRLVVTDTPPPQDGQVLDAALLVNAFGRIAVCSMIAGYDGASLPLAAPALIFTNQLVKLV